MEKSISPVKPISITQGEGIGWTEHDPQIKESDRTHCHVCGREASINWNFCVFCGNSLNVIDQTDEAE